MYIVIWFDLISILRFMDLSDILCVITINCSNVAGYEFYHACLFLTYKNMHFI